MKSARLIGREVVGQRGFKIGKVAGITFDESSWKVTSLEVRLFRQVAEEFRMRRVLMRTRIDVAVGSVHAIGDRVILSVSKTELRRLVSGPPDRPESQPPLPEPPGLRS